MKKLTEFINEKLVINKHAISQNPIEKTHWKNDMFAAARLFYKYLYCSDDAEQVINDLIQSFIDEQKLIKTNYLKHTPFIGISESPDKTSMMYDIVWKNNDEYKYIYIISKNNRGQTLFGCYHDVSKTFIDTRISNINKAYSINDEDIKQILKCENYILTTAK